MNILSVLGQTLGSSLGQSLVNSNTHTVGQAGLGSLLVGVAIKVAAQLVDAHAGTSVAKSILDAVNTDVATPLLAGGGLAAYLGRPFTVATGAIETAATIASATSPAAGIAGSVLGDLNEVLDSNEFRGGSTP